MTPGTPTADAPGLIGRDQVWRSLGAYLAEGRLPSLLFVGPEGSGKRTLALRMAQAANCPAATVPCGQCRSCLAIGSASHPDVRLLFPARRRSRTGTDLSANGTEGIALMLEESAAYALGENAPPLEASLIIPVEAIRWIRHEMSRAPFTAAHRFFIVLHAERMTTEATNAFLKTLEEPQHQSTLILTTAAPSLLPDTIRSRCRLIRFPSVSAADISNWLVSTRNVAPDAADLAAEFADGSPGRALRFLDDPDRHLDPAIVDFFLHPQSEGTRVFETLAALERTPLTVVAASLLSLLDLSLRSRHGIHTCYADANPELARRARSLSDDYLRRAIRYVLGRLDEARLAGVNRRLFLYTILASLRRGS